MDYDRKVIFGPPGCGKTTKLLGIVNDELESGVNPDSIAFVSFTKKAADEAAERAVEKFDMDRRELPWFRTIHSLAFSKLGIGKKDVLRPQHYREMCDSLGLSFSNTEATEEDLGSSSGDAYLFADNVCRNMMMDPREWWERYGAELDWYTFDLFNRGLKAYKKQSGLMDFTDMLEDLLTSGIIMGVDVAIIDEAQDLTPLQWEVVLKVFGEVDRMYVAGDDDQAIYHWAGADVNRFINLKGQKIILDQSWRLPRNLFDIGNTISDRIGTRVHKEWEPTGEGGEVHRWTEPEYVDITKGDWLLLARNRYLLGRLEKFAIMRGVHYSTKTGSAVHPTHLQAIIDWERLRRGEKIPADRVKTIYGFMHAGIAKGHRTMKGARGLLNINALKDDHGLLTEAIWHEVFGKIPLAKRAYYITLLRQGTKLTSKPTVHIDTIHGVKGGEADNVMVLTDIAPRCYEELQTEPDNEHRVFYVAVTRAKKALHIILPQTDTYYEI